MEKAKTIKVSRAIELSRAISMPGSIMNTTGGALDVRYAAANKADRIGIPQASRYEGLQVFQQDTKVLYILKDNSTADGVWEAVALGGSVAEDLSKVIKQVTDLEGKVTKAEGKITANEKAIEGLNTKVAAAEGRLDDIDTEISDIKEAATELAGRVDDTEDRLDAVEPKVTTLEGEVTKVKGRLDVVEPKLNAVVAESAKNKSDITALTKKVEDNKTDVNKAISAVDKKVDDNKKETDGRLTAVEAKATANKESITALNSKVDAAVETLGNKDAAQDVEIQKLKDAITNSNNNTVVVNTFPEIAIANPKPKTGDLAYVVSEKKSYIYTENAPTAKISKSGNVTGQWIEFDEISSELDLVDYLKTADAEATYRKLADKIAKGDLANGLVAEINAKAVKADVDEALTKKADKSTVDTALAGKADKVHTHKIADVTGLQDALNSKEAVGHKHTVVDVTDFAEKVDAAIVAKNYATNATVTALGQKVDAHIANTEKHVSETQKQQLVDLGVKGTEGSLFSKVEALEAKKVEVDNKTIVRSESDVISVKDGVFSKEGHKHVAADITNLDEHLARKGYASQNALDNHTNNVDIHVTKEQKDNWEEHRNNLGIHVQVGGSAPAPDTFGLWLDMEDTKAEAVAGNFLAGERTCG